MSGLCSRKDITTKCMDHLYGRLINQHDFPASGRVIKCIGNSRASRYDINNVDGDEVN